MYTLFDTHRKRYHNTALFNYHNNSLQLCQNTRVKTRNNYGTELLTLRHMMQRFVATKRNSSKTSGGMMRYQYY